MRLIIAQQILSSILIVFFTFLEQLHMGIKPGPKPKAKSTKQEDRRRSVTPDNASNHPTLDKHKHKPGD